MEMIVNPASCKGRGLRVSHAIAQQIRRLGATVRIHQTHGPGDARRLAAQACNLDHQTQSRVVVACGGDGCVQEVADALARAGESSPHQAPALGIAPAGRCNDFARALGVTGGPARIAAILLNGSRRHVDLGRVNGRYFCTVLAVGLDAAISDFVDRRRGPLRGTPAYLYGAIRVLARYRPAFLTLKGDFGTEQGPMLVASAANTSSYGGAIRIVPGADPFDGWLDLCLIANLSRARVLALLPRVLLGRHVGAAEVRFVRTRKVEIQSDRPVALWADGERIAATPVLIESAPRAIEVIVPHQPTNPDERKPSATIDG